MIPIMPITEARSAGLKRYFTGHACKYGHIAERFVSSRKCVVCSLKTKSDWAADNKSRVSQYNKTYLIENRAAIYANNNANRRRNPEKTKVKKAADHQKHKAKRLATMKVWREQNRDKVRVAEQRKRKLNPEQYASYKRNYKLRKRNAAGSHTGADILDILKMQRGKCACCREKLKKRYHVDHIIPLKAGGSNDRRNLQILCAKCNQTKSARDPITFMQMRGMLL